MWVCTFQKDMNRNKENFNQNLNETIFSEFKKQDRIKGINQSDKMKKYYLGKKINT